MKIRHFFPAALLAVAPICAEAMPAYPGLIQTSQPDGTTITIRLYGDENFCWARSTDGYTLLRDKDGFWTIATPDSDGILEASPLRLDGKPAAALASRMSVAPMLPMTRATVNTLKAPARVTASNLQVDCSFPTKGQRKLLMLLVNFADTQPTYTREQFESFMNAQNWGGIGSFRDFYLEDSYGQLDVTTTVTQWVTLPGSKRDYNIDNVGSMIKYALEQLSGQIDLRQFDNDGDGILDGLSVIHQGPGQEATGSYSDIWSHSSTLYGLSVGGIEVRRYTIQPETYGNTGMMSTIGVICHEFGHNLGAPDFYDTDYESSGGTFGGTGTWDLLGNGAWNGQNGDRPAHTNMWQKIMFGWVEPTLLTESMSVANIPGSSSSPVAYRFDTTSEGDYFIIENRQPEGPFDQALPGGGLIITHANEGIIAANVVSNTINATYPQGCYTVAANAGMDPSSEPRSYGYPSNPASAFSAGASFSDATLPSSRAVNGRLSYKGLSNIRVNADGTMSFDFTAEEIPAGPSDLLAVVEGSDVKLTWETPNAEGIAGYNVYRNSALIATVTTTSYTDPAPKATGKITYMVDAVYSNGKLSKPETVSIRVPQPKVTTVNAQVHSDGVLLSWGITPELSRMRNPSKAIENFMLLDIPGSTVEYAHKFLASDLLTYQGMKIRHINFLPYQSLQTCGYKIKIYEIDPQSGEEQVVSTRQIKEAGTGMWNTILLTQAVEILPGKDYIIAIETTPSVNVAQVITEIYDPVKGFGNLVRVNGGEWSACEEAAGNFFLYATLAETASPQQEQIADYGQDFDPDFDLFFPIGFRIYRDGQYIGESASRMFVDTPRPSGTHTYTISTLYRGNCETGQSAPITVNCDAVGIDNLPETSDPDELLFRPDGTRLPAHSTERGIFIRKGEKILK